MTPEGQILRSILDYLAVMKIWHRRLNAGAVRVDKRFVRFGSLGMGDIIATPPDRRGRPVILWLEVKTPRGKQSPAQIEFMDEVRWVGHYYAVVRSIEDVEQILKEIQ